MMSTQKRSERCGALVPLVKIKGTFAGTLRNRKGIMADGNNIRFDKLSPLKASITSAIGVGEKINEGSVMKAGGLAPLSINDSFKTSSLESAAVAQAIKTNYALRSESVLENDMFSGTSIVEGDARDPSPVNRLDSSPDILAEAETTQNIGEALGTKTKPPEYTPKGNSAQTNQQIAQASSPMGDLQA